MASLGSHIHAPGTLLNDDFGGDWDGFLNKIKEEPAAEVLGITTISA